MFHSLLSYLGLVILVSFLVHRGIGIRALEGRWCVLPVGGYREVALDAISILPSWEIFNAAAWVEWYN